MQDLLLTMFFGRFWLVLGEFFINLRYIFQNSTELQNKDIIPGKRNRVTSFILSLTHKVELVLY